MTNLFWTPAWKAGDYEIQEMRLLYGGLFQVQQLVLRHRLFQGEWSGWLTREFVQRQDAAAVILYDPIQNKVVMVEQFRVGLIGRSAQESPWMLEIVAGLLEEGEAIEEAIRREALEEAGCEIKELIKIREFYNSPGGFSEKTTIFCGIVDVNGIAGIHGLESEGEDILVHVLSPEWIFNAIDKNQIATSSSTMIAIQWLQLVLEKRKRDGKSI